MDRKKHASFAILCATVCCLLWRLMGESKKMAVAREMIEQLRKEMDSERKGRTKAERRLRMLAQQSSFSSSGPKMPTVGQIGSASSSDGSPFRPIGFVRSPFSKRCGTPRQSGLASARSTIEVLPVVNPSASMDGLDQFSHLWILYIFHENTNATKEQKILDARNGPRSKAPAFQGLLTKIKPPRCPDLKVGVFSCRSPHRPNPIGLSLGKVVQVRADTGTIVLEGLDLLDGTPVLDIKPYLPQFDNVLATVPKWVQASYDIPRLPVAWADAAHAQFDALEIDAAPFETAADVRVAIDETLSSDIRSSFQKKKHPPQQGVFFTGDLEFHGLTITYSLVQQEAENAERMEEVTRVMINDVKRRA